MIEQTNGCMVTQLSSTLMEPILTLQYADDNTAIIAKADLTTMITLMLMLRLFTKVSGLHINNDQSSSFPLNLNNTGCRIMSLVLGSTQTSMPILYLGKPVNIKKPSKHDFIPLIEKIKSKIDWQGKILYKGGRLQLIKSVLTSPIYFMTCFVLPKWVLKSIHQLCRNFFWGKSQGRGRGVHLINWEVLCLPRCYGGLGVPNMGIRNLDLLLCWWWKWFIEHDNL